MNVEEVRTAWIGRLVDGRFPLREFLGGSDTSAVFLTELPGDEPQKAVIKLIPAEGDDGDKRLGGWALARAFSHPHLLRILHSGSFIIEGVRCVYVVTECADEVLSEIIPSRPLTPDETRQMLAPVLDVLGWLHGSGFVHGHVKPGNIFVLGDEIKLSADGLQAAGANRPSSAPLTIYDAPEVKTAPLAPANDLWSLGITLVETLTQHQPEWDRASKAEPVVPAAVPQPFADIARGCLRPIPTYRIPLSEIVSRLETGGAQAARQPEVSGTPKVAEPVTRIEEPPKPAPKVEQPPQPARQLEEPKPREEKPVQAAPQISTPQPVASDEFRTPARAFEPEERKRPNALPMIVVLVIVLGLIAFFVFRGSGKSTQTESQAPASSASTPAPQAQSDTPKPQAAAPAPSQSTPAPSVAPGPGSGPGSGPAGSVAQRVMPQVLASAQSSIHGTLKLSVRLSVDATGRVTDASLASAGPSRYFDRVALEASRNWRFNPPRSGGQPAASTWILHYQFRRDSIDCSPQQVGQ